MDANYHAIADLFGSLTVDHSDPSVPTKLGETAEESDRLGRMSLEAGKYAEAIEHFKNADQTFLKQNRTTIFILSLC